MISDSMTIKEAIKVLFDAARLPCTCHTNVEDYCEGEPLTPCDRCEARFALNPLEIAMMEED